MKRRFFGPLAGELELRPDEHLLLRDLLRERLGIWFGPESRASLERRLRERLVVRGIGSFGDYYQFLRYAPQAAEEWEEVHEAVTTNETYFFREEYQFRAFLNELLPMFAARNAARRRLHIWSAGCSTGEEVYTIAMLLLESRLFEGWDVRVYGSDLSKRCIAAARRGVYGESAFRATADEDKRAWFVPDQGVAGHYAVSPSVRALCHFGQLNLMDTQRIHLVGRSDIVFCRNVLLYFDAGSRRQVIETMHERLVPGGVLLLGHAESLLNVSTAFELLHLKDDLVYRKPTST